MARALAFLLAALLLFAAQVRAQDSDGFDSIEVRVTSARSGSAVIDRGTIDGLAQGDRVRFFPRSGGVFEGTLSKLEERSAVVELHDPSFVPLPGTRGKAWFPAGRAAAATELARPAQESGEHPPWKNQDETYVEGEPLLAKVEPLRPEQRPASVSARLYWITDYTDSSEDDRTDLFTRAGADILYDNLFGYGDQLHLDGELNYRNTDVPDNDDESSTKLRVDRLSYTVGGTRFADARMELGRFLQYGMPEFGVVDGMEWSARADDGDRYGVSVGFMPEPNADYETGTDFQLAAHYRWVYDESEQLSAAAGFQKTLHNGDADRDLFIAQVLYLPLEGWTFHGTAWLDYYTSGDDAKGSGLDPTQIYTSLGKRWDSGSSFDLVYTHLAFPEIDRNEFTPVAAQQLADDHNERLAMTARMATSEATRVRSVLGAWIDEDETGGDVELGYEVDDFAFDHSLAQLVAFGTRGRFVLSFGGRVSLGMDVPNGRWNLEYELATHHIDGFTSTNDDLLQHRIRASRDFSTASGWSISGHLDAVLWDSEQAFTAGFYLQKSF